MPKRSKRYAYKPKLDFSQIALYGMIAVFAVFGILVVVLSRAGIKPQPQSLSSRLVPSFAASLQSFVEKSNRKTTSAANIATAGRQVISCPKNLLDLANASSSCGASSISAQSTASLITNYNANLAARGITLTAAQATAEAVKLASLSPDLQVVVSTLAKAETQAEQLEKSSLIGLSASERSQLFHQADMLVKRERGMASNLQSLANQKQQKSIEKARDDEIAYLKTLMTSNQAQFDGKFDDQKLMMAATIMRDAADVVKPNLISEAAKFNLRSSATLGCNRPGPIFCDDYNLIEIWGPEDNTYTTDAVAKIRVDLGGNDSYKDHTGTALGDLSACDSAGLLAGNVTAAPGCATALKTKINIDVSGNDTYTAPGVPDVNGIVAYEPSQGVGLVGVGALIDMAGKDSYLGGSLAQGAAAVGAGLLVDEGNDDDVYNSFALAQGSGVLGAGVLVDEGGNETYHSLAFAQGGTILGGGAIVDGAGNDQYYCLLVCQGGSILGAGLIVDGSGNDQYKGLELGLIELPVIIGQGGVIGTGAGGLVDLSGDDTYHLLDFGQSLAISVNLVYLVTGKQQTDTYGLLFDNAGTDTYQSGKIVIDVPGVGRQVVDFPAPDSYALATGYAAARFWDYGSGNDTYFTTNPNPANNKTWTEMEANPSVTKIWVAGYDTGQTKSEGKDQ